MSKENHFDDKAPLSKIGIAAMILALAGAMLGAFGLIDGLFHLRAPVPMFFDILAMAIGGLLMWIATKIACNKIAYKETHVGEGSVIAIERHPISDIAEGKVVSGSVFFTADGHAFIWTNHDIGGSEKVWREGDKWYAKLDHYPDSVQITGWGSIAGAGGTAVTLIQGRGSNNE